jgi:hypothetical protein
MLEAFKSILVPGSPSYDRTKSVIDNFMNDRKSVESTFFTAMNKGRPASRYFDIRSISLPDEAPARFGIRFDPEILSLIWLLTIPVKMFLLETNTGH